MDPTYQLLFADWCRKIESAIQAGQTYKREFVADDTPALIPLVLARRASGTTPPVKRKSTPGSESKPATKELVEDPLVLLEQRRSLHLVLLSLSIHQSTVGWYLHHLSQCYYCLLIESSQSARLD
jgi:hypothetical protein